MKSFNTKQDNQKIIKNLAHNYTRALEEIKQLNKALANKDKQLEELKQQLSQKGENV